MTQRKTRPRKKKPTAKTKPDGICAFGDCQQAAAAGGEYCLGHYIITGLAGTADQAERRGDVWRSLLLRAGSTLADHVVNNPQQAALHAQVAYQQAAAWRASRQQQRPPQGAPPPPQAAKPCPFAVLRLDPKTATVADVKRVQRELAKIYHADKGGKVAADAMAEINAAATAALEQLRATRGRAG